MVVNMDYLGGLTCEVERLVDLRDLYFLLGDRLTLVGLIDPRDMFLGVIGCLGGRNELPKA